MFEGRHFGAQASLDVGEQPRLGSQVRPWVLAVRPLGRRSSRVSIRTGLVLSPRSQTRGREVLRLQRGTELGRKPRPPASWEEAEAGSPLGR